MVKNKITHMPKITTPTHNIISLKIKTLAKVVKDINEIDSPMIFQIQIIYRRKSIRNEINFL